MQRMDASHAPARASISVSYDRLGEVEVRAGELAAARAWFERALIVCKTLAANQYNADRQRDLSVSYDRLGEVGRGWPARHRALLVRAGPGRPQDPRRQVKLSFQ
jgi:hypothetical protein